MNTNCRKGKKSEECRECKGWTECRECKGWKECEKCKKNRMNGSQGKVQKEWNSITADFNIYHSTPRCREINPFCINIVPLQHFVLNQ